MQVKKLLWVLVVLFCLSFYLLVVREEVQSLFVVGNEDNANWNLTRSEKRMNEAKIFKIIHLGFLSQRQLDLARVFQTKAASFIEKERDHADINYLLQKLKQDQDKLIQLQTT